MEKIVMPEIITPAFAEVMASNPEILEQLLGTRSNEEAVREKDFELNSNDMPKELKFLFCNVTIKVDNSDNVDWEAESSEEIREDGSKDNYKPIPSNKEVIRLLVYSLKAIDRQLAEKNMQLEELSGEVALLKEEVVIIETRMKESARTIKLVFKEIFNRKLSYRYKMDVNSLSIILGHKNKALEEKSWILEQEKCNRKALEEKYRDSMNMLIKQLEENSI